MIHKQNIIKYIDSLKIVAHTIHKVPHINEEYDKNNFFDCIVLKLKIIPNKGPNIEPVRPIKDIKGIQLALSHHS